MRHMDNMVIGSVSGRSEDGALVTDKPLKGVPQAFRRYATRVITSGCFGEHVGKPIGTPIRCCDEVAVGATRMTNGPSRRVNWDPSEVTSRSQHRNIIVKKDCDPGPQVR